MYKIMLNKNVHDYVKRLKNVQSYSWQLKKYIRLCSLIKTCKQLFLMIKNVFDHPQRLEYIHSYVKR